MVEEINLSAVSKFGGALMSAMHRYLIPDEYTLSELKRKYETFDSAGRTNLLQDLSRANSLPYQLELMAVEDHEVQVRQWIARHGSNLKYTTYFHHTEAGWVHEKIHPTLYERLNSDPDPFVRACLRENPNVTLWQVEKELREASHLERLALMRNLDMWPHDNFLRELFDYEDKKLAISEKERAELILAFLTNEDSINKLQEDAGLSDESRQARYSFNLPHRETLLTSLWELAAKWPIDKLPAPVPDFTYRYVPVEDETKAKIYQACDQGILRQAILEGSSKWDVNTLKLGVRDKDSSCRGIARSMIEQLNLHNQIDAYPDTDVDATKPTTVRTKLKRWREKLKNFLSILFALSLIPFGLYGLLFTEPGNRLLNKVIEFYATPFGMVVIWILLIIGAYLTLVIFLILYARYRWFYHCFWLGLIGGFYFFAESEVMTGIFAGWYAASIILPKIWEGLSNDVVNKIVTRLEASKKQTSP